MKSLAMKRHHHSEGHLGIQIVEDGIFLNERERKSCYSKLQKIEELVPIGSLIQLHLRKSSSHYQGELEIVSYDHFFEANAIAANTTLLLHKLESTIKQQISSWKVERIFDTSNTSKKFNQPLLLRGGLYA